MDFKVTLDGKVALVTGGGRGLGRAMALAFADAGAKVAIASRKVPELEAVAGEIKAKGGQALVVPTHLAKMEDIKGLVEKVTAEFGRIDILVNNAGINPFAGPLLKIEEWVWDTVMNVNLKGMFFLTQLVVPVMRKQGSGNIINLSSIGGMRATGHGVYGAAKAAIIMLTQAMAKEWGQYNIRVNAIAPGTVKTRFTEGMWKDQARAEALAKTFALGRLGEPEDIAKVALFLVSDASSYMTGVTLLVDGGQLVGQAPWPPD